MIKTLSGENRTLSACESEKILYEILCENSNAKDVFWVDFFSSIQKRLPTEEEILGFIKAVQKYDDQLIKAPNNLIEIKSSKPLVTITGSGKETFKTINVSTAAAIIASTCGVNVIKPGSISTSAISGSVDILNELNIPIVSDLDEVEQIINNTGLVFLDFSNIAQKYARRYDGRFYNFHPLSYVLPILAFPFHVDSIIYGIADNNTEMSARIFREFNYNNVSVVNSILDRNLSVDEYSPYGISKISKLENGKINTEFYKGLEVNEVIKEKISQRRNHVENAKVFYEILNGTAEKEVIKLVATNAALLIMNSGVNYDFIECEKLVMNKIFSGEVVEKLNYYKEYTNSKYKFREMGTLG